MDAPLEGHDIGLGSDLKRGSSKVVLDSFWGGPKTKGTNNMNGLGSLGVMVNPKAYVSRPVWVGTPTFIKIIL